VLQPRDKSYFPEDRDIMLHHSNSHQQLENAATGDLLQQPHAPCQGRFAGGAAWCPYETALKE